MVQSQRFEIEGLHWVTVGTTGAYMQVGNVCHIWQHPDMVERNTYNVVWIGRLRFIDDNRNIPALEAMCIAMDAHSCPEKYVNGLPER